MTTDTVHDQTVRDQKAREAYFTASQRQLVWARFKKQRAAMTAAMVLVVLVVSGLLAPFLSPYDPTMAGRNKDYMNGAPNVPMFCDKNGCSLRPFLHTIERERSIKTNFRWVETINEDKRRYVQFLVEGSEYKLLGFIPAKTHLFGISEGRIHLFGTDASGKDIFSRTLHAIWTSLQVGSIGVFIAFVLALIIGGISGYYGGWIDSVLQMVTDAVRTVPAIPLFMAIAAFIPQEWTAEMRFFFISLILGLIGWPTLARRVRTHLLTERNQEYVLASETALSFIGLGLKDPVNSLGVMLQNVTSADVLLNYQWYFIPVIFFITLVMAFVFVGDGLRDAADPYSDSSK